MSTRTKRTYTSTQRSDAANATRSRVLRSAKALFARRGIDAVTIAEIAARARVSTSTVYGMFESKEGVLLALMEGALFGARYRVASAQLDAVSDPIEQLVATAAVARAVYEGETSELSVLRGASSFSPALRAMERRFETARFAMQEDRVAKLYAQGKARTDRSIEQVRRLLWMYTSRDVYRMLVEDGGWTPDEYEAWLAKTLVEALAR